MPKRVNYPLNKIIEFLDDEVSWRQINRRFGKSEGTVEKWLKTNKIEITKQPAKYFWVTLDQANSVDLPIRIPKELEKFEDIKLTPKLIK